jgi:hypothetical protein
MKNSRRKQMAIATVGAGWLRTITVPMKAFHHRRTALRDERNGFPYSAALEWRRAAELLAPNTLGSEYCWRRWERIMHLPRRFADPIRAPVTKAVRLTPASATQPETTFPLPIAA